MRACRAGGGPNEILQPSVSSRVAGSLHVKTMSVCILDATGLVLVHRNVKSTPEAFLEAIAPYRDDRVVAAECMFTWFWVAGLCAAQDIPFVLGHVSAMKAIHGGKAKNDKIAGNEDGTERERDDSAFIACGRASS